MPKIPTLRDEENLQDWDRQVKNYLRFRKYMDFIKDGSASKKPIESVLRESEPDF